MKFILITIISISTSVLAQELGLQHTTMHYKYIGDFYNNQCYLFQGEEPGQFAVKMPDGTVVADVISNREELTIMFHDPNNGKVAFIMPSDPEFKNLKTKSDLQWQEMTPNTLGDKVWTAVKNPNKDNPENIKGKTQQWYFVDRGWVEDHSETTFVSDLIKNQELELEMAPIITVTEERRTFEIDPSKKSFKTQTFNPMAEPIGEEVTRPMKDGDIATAILKQAK